MTNTGNRSKWNCECSIFYEDMVDKWPPSQPYISRVGGALKAFSYQYPDYLEYMSLINSYDKRDLSYPEDAMPAFASIVKVLSPKFYGGFICGLPTMFLDTALCWQAVGLCKRRQASSISPSAKLGLPSWSWVGWKCTLNTSLWSCESDYFKSSRDRWTYRHFGPRIISTA